MRLGLGITIPRIATRQKYGPATVAELLNRFQYAIDFRVPSVKGGTQQYGNNTLDGRLLRDPNNITPVYIPDATGLMVLQANAGIRRTSWGSVSYPSYGTCRNLYARDFTQAAVWIASGITPTRSTGADGVASAGSRLTATAPNGTIIQAITLAQSTVLVQCDIKRVTGTGTVEMTTDNGGTWTPVTPGAGAFSLQSTNKALVTNPQVGFRLGTTGDAIDVDFFNTYSNPPNSILLPTQYRIATTSATILGSQSRPSADIADGSPLITVARGPFAFYWQGRSLRATGAYIITGATNVFLSVQSDGSIQFTGGAGGFAKTAAGVWKSDMSLNKVACCYLADGTVRVAANGSYGSGTGTIPETALDHWDLFTNGAGQNSGYGVNEMISMSPNLGFSQSELLQLAA